MKILIEGHTYEAEKVKDICGEFEEAINGEIKVSKIGYYFNPEINDCVICLPKVVSDSDGLHVFGGLKAEDIIDAFDSQNKLNEVQTDFVQNFALWAYRAISTYSRLNPYSSIVSSSESTKTALEDGAAKGTLLDVILSIIHFYDENRDYFMYIIKNLHSGNNRINWKRTIESKTPILQNNAPVYFDVVNRRKQINFDEELMIIFHSILDYISTEYGLNVHADCNYNLIKGADFESYMDGLGLIRLNAIKYKYFSDKDVQLWRLCYAFFLKTAKIEERKGISDYLLIGNFEIVFEAMVDAIISDKDLPDILKNQKDGKIVDHIFKYYSPIDGKDIYYIGDSKYYSIGSTLGDNSIYKQFTYAKNIIQYHFINSKKKLDEVGYRDALTEGYNFTPNFFISAFIPDTFSYNNSMLKVRDFSKDPVEVNRHRMSHFENRFFDRDTLWLSHFDVNLLFILSLYASDNPAEQNDFKIEFKHNVYKAIQNIIKSKYTFYSIKPKTISAEEFVKQNFYLLNGKIYRLQSDLLIMALENGYDTENEKIISAISGTAEVKLFELFA